MSKDAFLWLKNESEDTGLATRSFSNVFVKHEVLYERCNQRRNEIQRSWLHRT